ncbi:MAG: MBOAT family O-acyltransferase [Elainellaceae cyanobacterium]
MLFNSYEFIFCFLPVTLAIFFGMARLRWMRAAVLWLLLASLFFYSYWNPAYLSLLLLSTAGNYCFGHFIQTSALKSSRAKLLLWAGIAFNLIILGYYKYAEFFLDSFTHLFNLELPVPSIVLPLAISFYSFTQIAYLVDAYKGETRDQHYDFLSYCLFVTFFPQLIAGPILRHNELIPQFKSLKNFVFSHQNIALGLLLFTIGLAKKVLIADRLSPTVALVFDHASDVGFTEAWIGSLSYTLQLYFDFSGYSDMAIALGLMFNIHLPINFNSPYKSTSIIDFWRRWHITLSHFLRDYLYIPLGGNRLGKARQYGNLLITMLLGGLWHGAGWTYVLWGGLHGAFLVVNHTWRKTGIRCPTWLGWGITFVAILASWVVFRAANLADAVDMLMAMAGMKGIVLLQDFQAIAPWLESVGVQFQSWTEFAYLPANYKRNLLMLGVLLIAVVGLPNSQEIVEQFKPNWWWAAAAGGVAAGCLLSLNQVSEFLYFQF